MRMILKLTRVETCRILPLNTLYILSFKPRHYKFTMKYRQTIVINRDEFTLQTTRIYIYIEP